MDSDPENRELDDQTRHNKPMKTVLRMTANSENHFAEEITRGGRKWKKSQKVKLIRYPQQIVTKTDPETRNSDQAEEAEKMAPVELWRRKTKLVCMMCRVCTALQKYSHTAGYVDMDQYERGAVACRITRNKDGDHTTREEVTFNKNDYKTIYEFTWPQGAKNIIRKLPHERTPEDCASIRSIMRNLHSFRKYTDEMQGLLSKVIRYCRYGPKRVVVRKGHRGHNLYFVFSGAVNVVFDKEETSIFAKPVEISVLRKGEVFGEIALLKNTTRNATIVCATDTELLAVDREEFRQYGLYDLFLKECQYRIDFLSNLDLFSTWPRESIEDLCYVSRIEPYSYNRVIIKDATKSEWIYFISRGCCELIRLVDLAKSQDFQLVLPPAKRNELQDKTIFLDMETSADFMRSLTENKRQQKQQQNNSPIRPKTSDGGSVPKIVLNEEEDVTDEKMQRISSSATSKLKSGEVYSAEKLRQAAWAFKAASTISTRKKMLSQRTEPDTEYGRVGVGMFVQVDLLRPGQAFGLTNFYEPPRFFSLVSKGSEVIRVPRSKFRELADDVTMDKIRHLISGRKYPLDENICRNFMRENTWNLFKQDLVDVLVTESAKRISKKMVPDITPSAHAQAGHGRKQLLRRCQTATGYERPSMPRIDHHTPGRRGMPRHSLPLANSLRQHTTSSSDLTSIRPRTAAVITRRANSHSENSANETSRRVQFANRAKTSIPRIMDG